MLYPVLAKYYAATGNPYLAGQYVDSTLISNENHNEEFHTVRLLHAEQRLHREEMNTEQVRSEGYRRVAVTVSVTLIIVSLLLFVIVYFYRKKRKAYRELVRHSQSWAGVDVSEVSEITGDPSGMENGIVEADTGTDVITAKPVAPEESDKIIMQSIEKAMSEKKLYKCSDLSLDSLAAETGFSRYYVSQALNRCAGKNFSSYVNDYRIKEAIRIMSEPSNGNLTLDGIAYESGFNDRQNFHRVFKKKTGLPPGDFRKNMNRK